MTAGRPSDYTQEMADKICELISSGGSLRTICEPDDMPSKSAVFRWLGKYEEFRDQYARAKEESAELFADEIVNIADSTDDPQKARVQIDARKWVASKLKPKKYGDRVQQEISGPDGGAIKTSLEVSFVEK